MRMFLLAARPVYRNDQSGYLMQIICYFRILSLLIRLPQSQISLR